MRKKRTLLVVAMLCLLCIGAQKSKPKSTGVMGPQLFVERQGDEMEKKLRQPTN